MRDIIQFTITTTFLIVAGTILYNMDGKLTLEHKIHSTEPFFFEGKEWHCALTPKQVETDIILFDAQKKIKELK